MGINTGETLTWELQKPVRKKDENLLTI